MPATIAAIHHFPVKGLNAQVLDRVPLNAGQGLPHDRRFALTHGASDFDPAAPAWRRKHNFLMLMRDEALAALDSRFDPSTLTLSLARDGAPLAQGRLDEEAGRAALAAAVARHLGEAPPPVRLVEAPGHMFSDAPEKMVSLINLASVAALEPLVGKPVDPRRFRGNLLLDGLAAWAEFDWLDRELQAGGARLRVVRRIQRCAATNVDPATAARDLNIPKTLMRAFGHGDCGVYATVLAGGDIATGDPVTIAP